MSAYADINDLYEGALPEGRLLIEANAGAGKTYTLVLLWLRLVLEYGIAPRRIALVTFSRSACAELAHRLSTALADIETLEDTAHYGLMARLKARDDWRAYLAAATIAAERAEVSTIHTFAMNALRLSHAHAVPHGDTLDDEARARYYHRAMQAFWLNMAQDANANKRAIFLRLFPDVAALKKIFPQAALAWRVEVPEEPGWYALTAHAHDAASDAATDANDAASHIKDATHYLGAVCGAFVKAYVADRMLAANLISYDGMIEAWCQSAVERPAFAEGLRGQYDAVLVDEFQDTDRAQWRALAEVGFSRLILVGDVKQAIYEFRSADVSTFTAAREAVGARYLLADNYRSSANMVAAINALYARMADKAQHFKDARIFYEPSCAINPAVFLTCDGVTQPPIQVRYAEQTALISAAEARDYAHATVLSEVQTWLASGRIADKRILPEDILILTRSNDQVAEVKHILDARGIATAATYSVKGEAREWQVLAQFLASVKHIQARRLCDWAFLPVPIPEPSKNAAEADVREAVAAWQTGGPLAVWQAWVLHPEIAPFIPCDWADSIAPFIVALQAEWHAGRRAVALLELWLARKIADTQARHEVVRVEKGVRIMTVHKAKGLESPVVIVPFFYQTEQPSRKREVPYDAARLPLWQPPDTKAGDKGKEKDGEPWRMFYVAITRAKYHVSIYAPMVARLYKGVAHSVLSAGEVQSMSGAKYFTWFMEWVKQNGMVAKGMAFKPMQRPLQRANAHLEPSNPSSDKPINNADRAYLPTPAIFWPRGLRALSYTALKKPSSPKTSTPHDDDAALLTDTAANTATANQTARNQANEPLQGKVLGNWVHRALDAYFGACAREDARWVRWFENLNLSEAARAQVTTLAKRTLYAPLSPTLRLANAPEVASEVRFDMPIANWHLPALAAHLKATPNFPYSPLDEAMVKQGVFTGFMDAVFCETGAGGARWWLVDYKTNNLSNEVTSDLGANADHQARDAYDDPALFKAMQANHYGWQMAFYAFALYQHLTTERTDNAPFTIDIAYIFARGVANAHDENVAPQGVWRYQFTQEDLAAMHTALNAP